MLGDTDNCPQPVFSPQMMRRRAASAPFMGSVFKFTFFWRLHIYFPAVLSFACFAIFSDLAGYFLSQLILKMFHFEKCFCLLMLLYAFCHQEWSHVLQNILAVFNKIFLGRHPCQNVKILRCFRDWNFYDIEISLSALDVVLAGQNYNSVYFNLVLLHKCKYFQIHWYGTYKELP